MGLFDFFKKKKYSVEEESERLVNDIMKKAFYYKTSKPDDIWRSFSSEFIKKTFPGGTTEIDALVSKIMSLTNNRIPKSDVRRALCKAATWLQIISEDKTEKRIVSSITLDISSINNDDAKLIYNVLLENKAEHMYGSAEFAPILRKTFGNVEENPIHNNHGPLGCNTNPVPVCGVPASHCFVHQLVLEDGSSVNIKRSCSGNVDVCSEIVDFYDAYDSSGKKVASFVICPYCPETSKLPPVGFKFRN